MANGETRTLQGCEQCKDKLMQKGPKPYAWCGSCGRDLSEEPKSHSKRSNPFNRAYFAWITEIAKDCENRGITMQDIVEKMHTLEVKPTKDNIHNILTLPFIEKQFLKTSSTELDNAEMQQVVDALTLFFGTYFDSDVPFDPVLAHYAKDMP